MKRNRSETDFSSEDEEGVYTGSSITPNFIKHCKKTFYNDNTNIITRNAITALGSQLSTMNSDRINSINHLFMNTVKKKDLRATDQGRSGRCWMFSGLNIFRHVLIRALDLDNFEFSQTYLFFWDKWERSNYYLQWFIDNRDVDKNGRYFEYMITHYMSDGGWWNTFSNLVEKYGIVPKHTMNETFQSEDSDDMNQIIKEQLNSCVSEITDSNKNWTEDELVDMKKKTLQNIYNTLVKFLGQPPEKFNWHFAVDEAEDVARTVTNLNPYNFKQMVMPGVSAHDFVVLTHIPSKPMNRLYEVRHTSNMTEGKNCVMLNVNIEELAKYTMKSILGGFAVWFGADISQKFNFYHSALDTELDDSGRVFGNNKKFKKSEQIIFRNTQANHAMVFTGFNVNDKKCPIEWQVENSWSYFDNEVPGLDGWLTMSHSWFKKYVIEVAIHTQFLSRSMRNLLAQEPEVIDPFDGMAPATYIKGVNAPHNYKEMLKIGFERRRR